MFILDKKSCDLLHYLLELDEPETIMAISKALDQSRRKIYYHLEKINEALPPEVGAIVSYPRVGIVLTPQQKQVCQRLLIELDDYSYVMSVKERIQLTLTYIAVSKERVTIEKLMHLNNVSRNTVLNDLNEIRMKLSSEEYDITLKVTKAKGYFLHCHPLSRIQYLYRLLYTIYMEGSQNFIGIVKERIVDLTGFGHYFSAEVNDYLGQRLSSAQKQLGKTINLQDSRFMIQILPYLLLSYRSIELSDQEKEVVKQAFKSTWERIEYTLAHKIAEDLSSQFAIQLDEIEISLVAMLLLSLRKYRDTHLESDDYADMRTTLEGFLGAIEKRHGIHFQHRNELLNQLLMHSKALVYRKTYGVLSVNPLLKYIKESYNDLFEMTKSCVPILEEAWFIKITDDDIAYLTIHLGGELEKEGYSPSKQKQAVIVCDEGIGVQKLLLKQCRDCLKDYRIEAVFTSEQFYSVCDIMETDIVISTNDHIDSRFPTLVVHPVLSNDDILRLIRFSQKQVLHREVHFKDELDRLLQAYVPNGTERYALKAKIEKLVSQELMH